MDWGALRDLVAVAETGSLSGAARRLGSSQPTVGRRIEQLELQLDSRLFNRTPRGLELTHTGDQVLLHARRMFDEAMLIERIARGASRNVEGTVRAWKSLAAGETAGILPAFPGIAPRDRR